MQSPSSADGVLLSRQRATRPSGLALGCAVATALLLIAVLGASAEHGVGTAQLRREPASLLLSVLLTLGGLAGVGSLALLFWGLVTRNRRRLDGAEARRHSPVLMAGVLVAIFAVMAFLLALAARARHVEHFGGIAGAAAPRPTSAASTLPLNEAASLTTTGIVVGIVLLVVGIRLVRALGWRRALSRLSPLASEADGAVTAAADSGLRALGSQLALLDVADPSTEPDPRRAVVACYLALLDVAGRCGPERRCSETPAEYLRRALSVSEAAALPATVLTRLFERARYSRAHVDETMRSDAIGALGSLKEALLAGAAR